MSRIFLNKLVFQGSSKKPAIVEFEKGFNVISGPSDTGKSLIFECLNYVLGGSDPPKEPPESIGYTNLYLSLEHENESFTIERSVLSNDVRIYECHFDDINDATESREVSGSASALDSLSSYLLFKINAADKKLKKNEHNKTQRLTFNLLRKVLLIHELSIQSNHSPILTGEVVSSTVEKSLFRYLITGIDFSDIIEIQKPAIRKADANARIRMLDYLLAKNSYEFKDDSSVEELMEQRNKLDISIENEIENVSVKNSEIRKLQIERRETWKKVIAAESKIDQIGEILDRFELLGKHYQSDLDRLEAIIETGSMLTLTKDSQCPLCGSVPEHHDPNCYINNENIESIRASCDVEKNKIKILQGDLEQTIKEVRSEQDKNIETLKLNKKQFQKIDLELNQFLEPNLKKIKKNLRALFEKKKELELLINYKDQYEELEKLKAVATQDLKPQKKEKKFPKGVQATEVTELLALIEQRLRAWSFPDLDRIGFSEEKQDITIGNKNRADQGKGLRAITNSAFIISLMDFCLHNNLVHPGFVILDSPLTTFKGKKAVSEDEALPKDVKFNFYKDLSKTTLDRQIIVIENDDPPKSLSEGVNFITFTKEYEKGRYGFIPVSKGI